jgi:hypothetical protein
VSASGLIGIYRSRRQIVQAQQLEDGSYRVFGSGKDLSAESFAERFEPATPEDLVATAATNGNGAHPSAPRQKVGKPEKKTGNRTEKPARKPTEKTNAGYDWAKGRQMWNAGKSRQEIAAALGCGYQTVYSRSTAEKWPAQKAKTAKGPAPKAVKVEKREDSEISQMVRTCEKCNQRVKGDPCPVCQEPR